MPPKPRGNPKRGVKAKLPTAATNGNSVNADGSSAAAASASATNVDLNPDDYMFFWTTGHVNGWASQWYPASFKARIQIEKDGEEEEIIFPAAEHYMMLRKALLFSSPSNSNTSIAREIISITGTDKASLATVKALGRKVSDFDEGIWKQNREKIVLEGTLLKFRQNEELKEKLLGTGNREIVEASPRDRIWGIGFGEKRALESEGVKRRWGLNLLGKALVEARRTLREEAEEVGSTN